MSKADHYATLHAEFRWSVPEKFNIAQMCLHRWARDTPGAVAIIQDGGGDEAAVPFTYASLQRDAHRLSNALGSLGVTRGDRVAIVMPQRPQTAVALMALFQMGAIAVCGRCGMMIATRSPRVTPSEPSALDSRCASRCSDA